MIRRETRVAILVSMYARLIFVRSDGREVRSEPTRFDWPACINPPQPGETTHVRLAAVHAVETEDGWGFTIGPRVLPAGGA